LRRRLRVITILGALLMLLGGCASVDQSVRGGVLSAAKGRPLEVAISDPMLERARGWVQWTAQPDPLGAHHALRIRLRYSGAYRLYTKARTEDGAALESFNIERKAQRCSDDLLIPNCQFEEYLHVSLPSAVLQNAATAGLRLHLTSAVGVTSELAVPGAYLAPLLGATP
jgi:hypothetical protein